MSNKDFFFSVLVIYYCFEIFYLNNTAQKMFFRKYFFKKYEQSEKLNLLYNATIHQKTSEKNIFDY